MASKYTRWPALAKMKSGCPRILRPGSGLKPEAYVRLVEIKLPERALELERLFRAHASGDIVGRPGRLERFITSEPAIEQPPDALEHWIVYAIEERVHVLGVCHDARIAPRLVLEERHCVRA